MLNFYFITGFMGTGKTSMIRMLHEQLIDSSQAVYSISLSSQENSNVLPQTYWIVEDLDLYIEQKFRISISAYFEQFGEAKFRRAEEACLEEIFMYVSQIESQLQEKHRDTNIHVLISLGGGCIFDPQTRISILNFSKRTDLSICCHLSADFEVIQQRIQGNEFVKRPLAVDIQQKYEERKQIWPLISQEIQNHGVLVEEIGVLVEEIENNSHHIESKIKHIVLSAIKNSTDVQNPILSQSNETNREVEIW